MSLEILNELESRIQQTIQTIKSLENDNAILKQANQELEELVNTGNTELNNELAQVKSENERLKQELQNWQQRLSGLVSKITEMTNA